MNTILHGDCIELIKKLPDNHVNLVITSPPYYNQRTYTSDAREIGKEKTIPEYIQKLVELFKECLRVVKEDGSIVWNLGDKYVKSSLQLIPYQFAIIASNFATLVNNVSWVKSNPTPRQFKRRLVSSHEPFFHFVKSVNYYYDLPEEVAPAKGAYKKESRYFEQIEKSGLTEEQKWNATKELCAVVSEVRKGMLSGFRMKIRGIHAMPFGGQEGGRKDQILNNGYTIIKLHGRKIQKDVFLAPVESVKWNKHPAIYPVAIVERFIKMLTREGDFILDPFMGSGSTALACDQSNRRYIGFELCEDFITESKKRLK